jgi:hypothetical protein
MEDRHRLTANASADQSIPVAPLTVTTIGQACQITHRPAMNDQQEAAPRPNDLTLDPKYRRFVLITNARLARTLTTTSRRQGIYAFAFGERGLIPGLGLAGTKITPIHAD